MGSLLVALALALPAAPAQCTYAHDIQAGSGAPCSGVLIPDAAARECVRLKLSVIPRLELRIAELEDLRKIERATYEARIAALEKEAQAQRIIARNLTAPTVPLIERPEFVAPVSVLSTAAVLVGAFYLAKELQR